MSRFGTISLLVLTMLFGCGLQKASAFNRDGFVMEEPVQQTEISMAGNRLIVKNLPEDGVLEIYSIVGVKVYTREIKAGTNEYPINLPKGYYIIRIGGLVKKIALR